MPSSPIRKLAPYAEAAKRNGVHVYHLNIGQPDIKTPECGMEALRGIDREILEYSPSDGYLSLRTKMVSYYAQYGIYLSPDEIIITSGGSEAVLFAFLACLSPGDEIIVTDPFYANYMAFAISVGAVIKSVKTSIEDGFRLPPVEAFEKQITPKTKAILICNPNNPTGYLYTRAEMNRLRDIVRRYRRINTGWEAFPDKVFVHLNDTHPALVIPELMRILIDDEGLEWDVAWDMTRRSTGYTNHTILQEALEKWPVQMMERLLPRHLQIIYEINGRFLQQISALYPTDLGKLQRMSIIDETGERYVRMANLCIVGSSSVNGVAELHTKILEETLFADFYKLWPEKFHNVTNGITPRRWLLKANPTLSQLITDKIGDGWVTKLDRLRELERFSDKVGVFFQKAFDDFMILRFSQGTGRIDQYAVDG